MYLDQSSKQKVDKFTNQSAKSLGESIEIEENREERMFKLQSYLVHRLDRVTSGLMCIAKNREMAKRLSEEMSQRQASKEYTALLSSYSPFFPFPAKGVIRQSL
jgi:23S rRNA-/tRNA-specific pseudouridylate synthase